VNLEEMVAAGIGATVQVRAPDGTVIRFPAGTPPTKINEVMGQYHAQALAQRDARAFEHRGRSGPAGGLEQAADQLMSGRLLGFSDEVTGAGAAARTGLRNLVGKGPGYGMSDAYHAFSAADREANQQFQARHPGASLALQLAGGLKAPGTGAAGEFVSGASSLPGAVARGAAVGAGYGAAAGAGNAAPGERIHGAAEGAVIGAATGGAIPAASAGARKAAGAASDIGHNIKRAVGAADPAKVAQRRLASALAKDVKAGVDPASGLANWPGESKPTLADVGGENLRSTVRDAGSQGPARQTLQRYRDQVASDLQNHAQTITAKLTPGETRSPQQLADALAEQRSTNAQTNYAEPYAAKIDLNDLNVIQALRDPEGASAIHRAIAGARSNMDYGAMADLQAMKGTAAGPTGSGQVWPTTGRALDRVQIAFGNRGQQLTQAGSRDIGAGMFKRQALVNQLLDATPGLADARGDYRDLSRQIEAIGHGQKVATASPSMLADALQGAEAPQLGAAAVGSRDALMTAVGAPTEGAVGALNRLSTNTNTGRNMELIHGPEATSAWRSGIQAEAGRMENANYMAPNTGSQTHSKGEDSLASLLMHAPHAAMSLAKTVLGGGPLTDAERAAIVNPAIGDVSSDLLMALMKAKQAQGMFPGTAYLPAPLAAAAASSAQ
jgi:hypothetical protein